MSNTAALRRALLTWFSQHRRELPWRQTRDPYAIWLSEVMLQQTQVVTVIPYWRRFLERFPTVHALAAAPLDEVLSEWQGLGYYSRARNLHRCAVEVVAQHGGLFPATAEELRQLPGFGPYTAGAVASIAFGEAAPLVDGNVARVFSRLFLVDGEPGEKSREKLLWKHAAELVPGKDPGALNQALMELGALVCRVDNPACPSCPARKYCGAEKTGRVEELPPKKKRGLRKSLKLNAAVWEREGRWLFARRPDSGLFGGLWELPSTESESWKDTLGVELLRVRPLGTVDRALTHRDLSISVFEVAAGGTPEPRGYQELRWVKPGEVRGLGMSTAMQKALELARGATAVR